MEATEKQKANFRIYQQRNQERIKLRKHLYYLAHKEEILVDRHTHYQLHREHILEQKKMVRETRKVELSVKRSKWGREYNKRLKQLIISAYSGGENKCAHCGFTDMRALSIDHINGGGSQHRKRVGDIYRWMKRNNFPPGYQVLCMNCQWLKRYNKEEHTNERGSSNHSSNSGEGQLWQPESYRPTRQ